MKIKNIKKRIVAIVSILLVILMVISVFIPTQAATNHVVKASDNIKAIKSQTVCKSLPTLKCGNNTIKVTQKKKQNKKYHYQVEDSILGTTYYDHYSFVTFKVPKTGRYSFSYSGLRVKDNDNVCFVTPFVYKVELDSKKKDAKYPIDNICFRKNFINYDTGKRLGSFLSDGDMLTNVYSSNYKMEAEKYVNIKLLSLKEEDEKGGYSITKEEFAKMENECLKTLLLDMDNGRYQNSDIDTNYFLAPYQSELNKATYTTEKKLKKGDIILIGFTNVNQLTFDNNESNNKKDDNMGTDAYKTSLKNPYTIKLKITKVK